MYYGTPVNEGLTTPQPDSASVNLIRSRCITTTQPVISLTCAGRVSQIHVPTLIIGGSADKMTPFKFSTYLHEQISGSHLEQVEGGGHMLMLEQPELVAEAVHKWLLDQQF